MSYKILVVDDEEANLRMLERIFRNQYQVIKAKSGREALEVLKIHDVALIISDQRMPEMTGLEFLKRVAETRPHTIRIMITGYTDVNTLIEAINSEAIYKYIAKPWINEDLQQTVKLGLRHYETRKKQHELLLQNDRLRKQLKLTFEHFVKIILEMLELKDPQMKVHSYRTSQFAAAIGEQLNFKSEEMEQLTLAGLLHEFVHINTPNHILEKDSLTFEEEGVLIRNLEWQSKLLAQIPGLEDVASVIQYHQEHYDGKGYPKGLCGEQIPLQARIIAVADAYDTITAPYLSQLYEVNAEAKLHNKAIGQLQSESGKKFDPKIVNLFCELKSMGISQ